jgi:ubiquinone/menaquinone biosynthesis C-methylase UbiE
MNYWQLADEYLSRLSGRCATQERRAIRSPRANMILELLGSSSLKGDRLLDIGCGLGDITMGLASSGLLTVGVELDPEAIRIANIGRREQNVDSEFIHSEASRLPFNDESFIVVILNYVLEHVHNQKALIREVYRVLRPGGILYLATPNKWWILETHYKIPFLSWLPSPLSNIYLRLCGYEQTYTIKHLSWRKLRSILLREGFTPRSILLQALRWVSKQPSNNSHHSVAWIQFVRAAASITTWLPKPIGELLANSLAEDLIAIAIKRS